jgi:uncharacterized protein (TIGR03792 family)
MVIEWLKFNVTPKDREKFIQKDAEIWTATLSQYPGFLGKEIWIDPVNEAEVIFIIRWQTKENWKAIPQSILDETEKRFAQAVGTNSYEMTEASEYQVRKFPN